MGEASCLPIKPLSQTVAPIFLGISQVVFLGCPAVSGRYSGP